MWDKRPGVAAWYARIRERPLFKTAVEDWLTPADHERYAKEPITASVCAILPHLMTLKVLGAS